MTEEIGEFICPICHNKYFSSGEICPHRILQILDWQAAEIDRLREKARCIAECEHDNMWQVWEIAREMIDDGEDKND
jgi:hypothetical protein